MRGRETVSRRAHNPKIGGPTPSPATKKKLQSGVVHLVERLTLNQKVLGSNPSSWIYAEMVELVDTPGLEPGAVRCAGSSPVLGKLTKNIYSKKSAKKYWKTFWNQYIFHRVWSGIAQSVEQMTVNHWVVGSSPSPGEFNKIPFNICFEFECQLHNQQRKQ